MEEKLSKKISVLFTKTTERKLYQICKNQDRSVSNMIRKIVSQYVENVYQKS